MAGSIRFSHVGICVKDLVESTAFYTRALGFEPTERYRMGDNVSVLAEVERPVALHTQFLRRGTTVLELLWWKRPGSDGATERRPMNQVGLTHMAVTVDDVDEVIDRIARYGGTVHHHTRVQIPAGDHVFCTDPNGVRIEVVQLSDPGWFDRMH